ncbi:hypothetical protein B0H19DRAFT_1384732, partial [Mycena capillaripes]
MVCFRMDQDKIVAQRSSCRPHPDSLRSDMTPVRSGVPASASRRSGAIARASRSSYATASCLLVMCTAHAVPDG